MLENDQTTANVVIKGEKQQQASCNSFMSAEDPNRADRGAETKLLGTHPTELTTWDKRKSSIQAVNSRSQPPMDYQISVNENTIDQTEGMLRLRIKENNQDFIKEEEASPAF